MAGKSCAAVVGMVLSIGSMSSPLFALSPSDAHRGYHPCDKLPGHPALKAALTAARAESNGGFNLDMWGAIVNRDGVVCAVAFTGSERGSQWPGSRVIAAQKAHTANAFSLPGLALSTANLWAPTQPGGSLFGLQESNPVDAEAAYKGPYREYGTAQDPLVGKKIGGINVFGGGLGLYKTDGELVGAIGVSGDTSCADHNIAWRTRHNLHMDYVPNGVSGDPERPDNINYLRPGPGNTLADDFSHPICTIAGVDNVSGISADLPPVSPKAEASGGRAPVVQKQGRRNNLAKQ